MVLSEDAAALRGIAAGASALHWDSCSACRPLCGLLAVPRARLLLLSRPPRGVWLDLTPPGAGKRPMHECMPPVGSNMGSKWKLLAVLVAPPGQSMAGGLAFGEATEDVLANLAPGTLSGR